MPPPTRQGDRVLHEVTVRAATDMDFRRQLLKDPAQAIYDAFGVTIPSGHVLQFIEKPKGVDTLIVLPDYRQPGRELDDDELEAVAGGTTSCYEDTTMW
ncbi:MAG TPA: NHLP leader peptide family RiPP precursor [Longimicrobium sp.]|nr:NHLP leader peptide family RiPP precursor [Longimicrobium sp.]